MRVDMFMREDILMNEEYLNDKGCVNREHVNEEYVNEEYVNEGGMLMSMLMRGVKIDDPPSKLSTHTIF